MIYLLDTNTCIAYLNQSSQAVYQRLVTFSPDEVCICDVVKFELYYGAHKSTRREQNLKTLDQFFSGITSLPFDGAAAAICGELRADLTARGTPIGAYDLQIAAIALSHGLTLVTNNLREFNRVGHLTVETWQTDTP